MHFSKSMPLYNFFNDQCGTIHICIFSFRIQSNYNSLVISIMQFHGFDRASLGFGSDPLIGSGQALR